MNYQQQLQHPKWKEKREEVMQLANYKCEMCQDEERKDLQVHHGVYLKGKMAWEYDNEVLYCLCSDCHFHVQADMERAQYELGKRQLNIIHCIAGIKRIHDRADEYFSLRWKGYKLNGEEVF